MERAAVGDRGGVVRNGGTPVAVVPGDGAFERVRALELSAVEIEICDIDCAGGIQETVEQPREPFALELGKRFEREIAVDFNFRTAVDIDDAASCILAATGELQLSGIYVYRAGVFKNGLDFSLAVRG